MTEALRTESAVAPEAEPPAKVNGPNLRGTFHEMIWELVEYRELLWQVTLRDIRIRYKQAVIGLGWAIFMPIVIVGAGFLVKYAMAQMAGMEFTAEGFASMTVKAIPWAFFAGAIGFATSSLTGHANLITKIYFPREIFPLSAVLTQAFDSSIGATALAILVFPFLGIEFSLQTLWFFPLVTLLFLFTSGLALFLSCANLFFRDVKYIVQILLTFGIFFTPVFYEPTNLGPRGSRLMMLNPLTPLLEGLRLAIVEHHNLLQALFVSTPTGQTILAWHPGYLFYATAWAIFGLLGAWLMFHRLEFIYAEYI